MPDLANPAPDCPTRPVEHVDGYAVHHHIPDDRAPHARTSECCCGPDLRQSPTVLIYTHRDLRGDVGHPEVSGP
ncbi:MAG TPA: hypothetical protein VF657_11335 [Actinoplanes sp.]|jgi:hypothetical protein